MSFEVFDRSNDAHSDTPRVTLLSSAQFFFNKAAQAALGRPKYVELSFNKEMRAVGFRSVDENCKNGYNFNFHNRTVAGAAFFKAHGLPRDKASRYEAKMEGDLLVICLEP